MLNYNEIISHRNVNIDLQNLWVMQLNSTSLWYFVNMKRLQRRYIKFNVLRKKQKRRCLWWLIAIGYRIYATTSCDLNREAHSATLGPTWHLPPYCNRCKHLFVCVGGCVCVCKSERIRNNSQKRDNSILEITLYSSSRKQNYVECGADTSIDDCRRNIKMAKK